MRDWEDFEVFDSNINKYMPTMGEGETIASQICTAVNKLVYKWYNDGDVYDNTYYLTGWANDLSSYANWLYKLEDYVGECLQSNMVKEILDSIINVDSNSDYAELLFDLCDCLIDEEELETFNDYEKVGSIYKCEGKFKFIDNEDEED